MPGASLLLGLALAGMVNVAQAATPPTSPAPAIASHGKAIILPNASHQPDPSVRQRAVFNLTLAPASPAAADPGLERVARAVDLFTASGVPARQMDFVVLLSGGATDSGLDDPAYRARHGIANPSLGLIAQRRPECNCSCAAKPCTPGSWAATRWHLASGYRFRR